MFQLPQHGFFPNNDGGMMNESNDPTVIKFTLIEKYLTTEYMRLIANGGNNSCGDDEMAAVDSRPPPQTKLINQMASPPLQGREALP